MKLRIPTTVAIFALALAAQAQKISKTPEGVLVELSHVNTAAGTIPSVFLNHGQVLRIWITDTKLACYTYNGSVSPQAAVRMMNLTPPASTAELAIAHDEDVTAYVVSVQKIAGNACAAETLANVSWTIPVKGRWNLAVSGAFAGDTLTDPGFFLEPGVKKEEGKPDQQGFYVREDEDAHDFAQWNPILMAHAYRPGRMWVPFTFGVSTEESKLQVYFGTGIRFLDKLYLTAGYVNGPRTQLPTGIELGDFMPDATKFTPPKRNDHGVFVSVSLSFFDRSLTRFQNLVKAPPVAQ